MIFSDKEAISIIAEIGVNHEGEIESAFKMMEMVAQSGVKIVKFQSYTPSRYAAADNAERLERVSRFSLSLESFVRLKERADHLGLMMLSTPLTEDWVEMLLPLCPAYKIASGDITFKPVIEKAAQTGKELIISTGAATIEEIDRAVSWVKNVVGENKLNERLTLMHCVASYPTPVEQANMLSVLFLKERYGLRVGYSNHVIGMGACLAAVALGADVIEVHFTDRKTGRDFRDHELSFDQNDLIAFAEMAKQVKSSLGSYGKEPQSCELETRQIIRKGIVAAKNLKKGEVLTKENLMFARPATEFSSNDLHLLLGRKVSTNVKEGFLIKKDGLI